MPDESVRDTFIPPPGTSEADQRRQSFGAQADAYTKYRPGYPPEVFDYLLSLVQPADRPVDVVDIGAGTGQLTVGFLDRECRVTAVEPDARMREVLAARTGLTAVLEGSAESIPLPDASADLLTGAQMWHWVDPARALPEIARVLRPGGGLAIVWSLRDDSADWVKDMENYVDLPDSYKWFRKNDVPTLADPFGTMELREFAFTHESSAEGLVGLVGTFSHVALSERRAEIEDDVRMLATTHPELAGRETFDVPYVCKVFTARRGPGRTTDGETAAD